jgi:GTPase
VVHPEFDGGAKGRAEASFRLEEAVGLARAIDLDVVGSEIAPIRRPSASVLLGSGKVEELKERLNAADVDLVVMDSPLAPIQQRNLERAWKAKVIDRTGLILEIFGERARTREGVLQVEHAALAYQKSRLVRSWTHLERQRGGFGFLGGPGESQIELDRRRITERMTRIERDLDQVKRTRRLHRDARERVPYKVVALVGYTNAGKSTLFNRLTGAGVIAEDKLFATLDPTMRLIGLPSGLKTILSDTVGFISDLPTDLVAAFRATLEEVVNADLILHVRDISHPWTDTHAADVERILQELGIDEARRSRGLLEVWNKSDQLATEEMERRMHEAARREEVVLVSALHGAGVDDLVRLIDHRLLADHKIADIEIGSEEGALLAWLYEQCEVLARDDRDARIHLKLAFDPKLRRQLETRLGQTL